MVRGISLLRIHFGLTHSLVLGLIIGAVLIQYASWPWIFYVTAILAIPIATACILLIPTISTKSESDDPVAKKAKGLDVIGVATLTSALILLIYSLTTGPENGWATGGTLAPLIISLLMVVVFFFYETRIPEESAAL
jgi:predicted MFS family arabinose efflux permease